MSFVKNAVSLAFAGLLVSAPLAYAQVGGGTELPNSAEPNSVKPGGGSMSKSGMKGGMKGSKMKGGMKDGKMKGGMKSGMH